jgi:hypothetical protein
VLKTSAILANYCSVLFGLGVDDTQDAGLLPERIPSVLRIQTANKMCLKTSAILANYCPDFFRSGVDNAQDAGLLPERIPSAKITFY